MAALDAAHPGGGQIERAEQRCEKPCVAHPHGEGAGVRAIGGFQRQRQDFRVRSLAVGAAQALDARLQEFIGPTSALAEDGAEIGEGGDGPRRRGGQIGPADRDRIFRPQAQLLALGARGEEDAGADVLARQIKKHIGGLENRRFSARMTGLRQMGDDPPLSRRHIRLSRLIRPAGHG